MSNGDLLTLSRANDLPPKWDGKVVAWTAWRDQPEAFICPPPRERDVCPACGSVTPKVAASGRVAHRRGTTAGDIANYDRIGMLGAKALLRLVAFRCVDCRHDQVWDMDRDELWDLDSTDYGDDGSADPKGRW